jgi:membrane-associated phospholipid phosphatase
MKKTLIIFIALFSLIQAQTLTNGEYFRYAIPEAAKTWEGYVALGTAGILAGISALTLDEEMKEFMTRKVYLPPCLDKIGDKYVDHYWAFGVSALGALGRGYHTGNYLESFRYWASANVGTIALTYALKYSVGRTRPNEKNNYSFPSGHSSVAFSTATMFQMWYGWKAGIPAYALATLTAFQRLDDNQHWLSDVIMGATIGIVIPYMLYRGEDKAKPLVASSFMIPTISITIPLNLSGK